MKCTTPKKIYVKKNGTEYPIYVPCGKCYACQNTSRAEWAIRCKYELQNCACAAFVTLTYSNENLPHYLTQNTFKHLVKLEMLKPITARRWDFARLNPEHASKFIADMQRTIKETFDNKDLLFRFFLTAEYGDVSKRPHLHSVIFSPVELRLDDWKMILSKCWKYGNIDVKIDVNPAIINYVAKHQVKSCCGTPEQNRESPIFKKVSRYKGGIGYNMREDVNLKNRFFDDDEDNYIVNMQGNIEYKIAFPRYLRRYYMNERQLHEYELNELSNVSRENRDKVVTDILIFHNDLVVENPDGIIDWDSTCKKVEEFCRKRDFFQRQQYEKKRILQKISKLNNLNNNSYEHF